MATSTNTNNERFGVVADALLTVSHFSMIFNYGAADEIVFASRPLANPRLLAIGDPMEFLASNLTVTVGVGTATAAGAKALLDAMIAQHGPPTVSLGMGDMSGTGKANEISDSDYERQVVEQTTAE